MVGAKKPGGSQSSKAQLKAIGEALRQQKFEDAAKQAQDVLEGDSANFQALVFLGFALDKLDKLDEAVPIYEKAAALKPIDPQAWQGLIKVFEKQGVPSIPKYKTAALRLAEIFRDADEMYKCQVVVDTFVDFARAKAEGKLLVDALGIILPDSPIYPALEGRVIRPAATYETIAKILEADEKKRINTLIGERRTRLGARLVEVTAEVQREVFAESQLTHIYNELINWTNDDELRRTYEEKLLSYRVERLAAFVGDEKQLELEEVQNMAKGMVIIKHPFQLAWDITVDWQDLPEIGDWDIALLWEYRALFPKTGLGKVLAGFLSSERSPFAEKQPPDPEKPPTGEKEKELDKQAADGENEAAEEAETEKDTKPPADAPPLSDLPATDEDRLALLLEGVSKEKSLLAYRMMAAWHQHDENYQATAELMRKALTYLGERRTRTGLGFQHTEDAFTVYLATALIYYQEPHNHPEAKHLFEQVLAHNPKSTASLIGVCLICEEELNYDAAISFLERALERDRSDLRVRSEAAWARSLKGQFEHARDELEACVPLLSEAGLPARKLLALTQYRLAMCVWNLDTSKKARKDRNGAYRLFLSALKNDLDLAPAYTGLGIYYADYAKDRKRAYKCFMKAIELSASELEAGRRLVQSFADKRDWDSIELVAQRAVDSGQATPPWGSKRKPHSWPFAALGTAQLHKKEYNKAMMSFRTATRLEPGDYHSFVALAETYLRAKMHYSAVRAIQQAERIEQESGLDDGYERWYTEYLLGNIYRGVGEFDKAIELYEAILETRADEAGVRIALMHAMVESADSCVKTGLFGEAVSKATDTLAFAAQVLPTATADTCGFWTAVASACAVFSTIRGRVTAFPAEVAQSLVGVQEHAAYAFLQDMDGVGTGVVSATGLFADEEKAGVDLTRCLHATILAYKRALYATADDAHLQAVALYNLGWAEYQAHSCLPSSLRDGLNGYLRAAIQCFKRAIEREAGNRKFWNALGVAASTIQPPVAQHAFARSLYLGRGRAPVWANLGALALMHDDAELANKAFAEGQSSDPDYATSWLGQGYVALQFGEAGEARSLFMHAMDLSDASSLAARQQYAISIFDHLVSGNAAASTTDLVRPLLGLEQARRLRPQDLPYDHLFSLFRERIHDADSTGPLLEAICSALEADFEVTESAESLRRFAMAKSDLARASVALGLYEKAIECGEMALQLADDGGDDASASASTGELTAGERKKIQLSSHIAAGLARFFSEDFDGALADFAAVLQGAEKAQNPDAVCLFAQVLWAIGSEDARQRAQDELFEVIEAHPDHMQAILLLGAMAVLNGDEESAEAVVAELKELQTKNEVAASGQGQIGQLLHVLASVDGRDGESSVPSSRSQAQRNIMLHPHLPHGWANLAQEEDGKDEDEYGFVSSVALQLTRSLLPPRGELGPEDLARACVGTRRAVDAQVAIAAAPWLADGWQALGEAIEA